MTIVRKVEASAEVSDDLTYVLSDATVDRYGDTIEADGWDLRWFKRNPIALFNHNSDFPIGIWKDARVEGGKLKARLSLAAKGTSARIDELISLVEQGILRATSVGFKPIEAEPRSGGGLNYKRQELLETSLVSVPANPAALQVARSMHISDDVMRLAFGEQAGTGEGRGRGTSGENAAPPTHPQRTKTMRLGERIQAAETALVQEKDALTALVGKDDADPIEIEELTARIEEREGSLAALKRAETALAVRASSEQPTTPAAAGERRPFAVAAKKVEPREYVYRGLTAALLAHIERKNPGEVLQERYGDDVATRAVFQAVTKAATTPATTTTTGWAAELVQTSIIDFIESLMPMSVYPGLANIGGRFAFGRNGQVTLPGRNTATSVGGSFVGQGSPIPVRQGAFTATSLTPKKMSVITTFTREIAEHSTPQIEALLRQAILEDTALAIDTVLLDATAASTIRPAGLRNGVTVTTAASGGGFAALVGDIKALMGALITASNGNLRRPVWIMNPVNAISIALTQNAGGDFPFAAGLQQGTLQGYPVLQSSAVTAGMVILVDAADFFSATGDEPRFDVSDQATLHMEDTTPLAIGTAGTPTVVAAPVRSLFQTDSIALRMMLDMNWAMRRSGVVAWTQSVTW